jgi:alpha-glucosidase
MDRRGRVFTLWNTDAYAWDAARDPLYKSIPFVLVCATATPSGSSSTTRAHDVRCRQDGPECPHDHRRRRARCLRSSPGPRRANVLLRYTALTGRTPLPPKWALGFQAIALHLPARSARARGGVHAACASHSADGIWFDIGFQDANKPFTVDRKGLPGFRRHARRPAHAGLPHRADHGPAHREATRLCAVRQRQGAIDAFVQRKGADYVGKVWPGDSVFPDFSRTQVPRLVGRAVRGLRAHGRGGVLERHERAVGRRRPGGTMPDDVVHRLDDGSTRTHAQDS